MVTIFWDVEQPVNPIPEERLAQEGPSRSCIPLRSPKFVGGHRIPLL